MTPIPDDERISAPLQDIPAEAGKNIEDVSLLNRREFILSAAATDAAGLATPQAGARDALSNPSRDTLVSAADEERVPITLYLNDRLVNVQVDARATLLDTLRETLGLTGTKKGCDHGQCGACTVHVDGRRVLACLTLAAAVDGDAVTTIEGLARGDELHAMQAAFIRHDALQCGYCTPGQIMSAVALLQEQPRPSREQIREAMAGNLCRCGAYVGIVAAIEEVAAGSGAAAR